MLPVTPVPVEEFEDRLREVGAEWWCADLWRDDPEEFLEMVAEAQEEILGI
jgi:hypothetical protein